MDIIIDLTSFFESTGIEIFFSPKGIDSSVSISHDLFLILIFSQEFI
jgi:hypothetical protein